MHILIVGAGAVGQAYGYHLQKGGCRVTFYVRPRHLADLQRGLTVYPDLGTPRWTPETWRDYGVVTTAEEVRRLRLDQVWLTVPSPALYEPWLDELAPAWGDAGVVMLQPGLDDYARLLQVVARDRLARGLITLMSFHAPLPGQTLPAEGMAWWFPPLSPLPLSGPSDIVEPAVLALERGGCPATVGSAAESAAGSAALLPVIAELERAGWSFAHLRQPQHLQRATGAVREAMAVTAAETGQKVPLSGLLRPGLLGLVTRVAPLAIPFDLERFLEVHFRKVGHQTRQALAGYADKGQRRNLPTEALQAQLAGLQG